MALILEDGSGVDGANCYVSVAEADAFFAARNILNWAGDAATSTDKEGFLIEGADYLNAFYSPLGEPVLVGQSMGLPTLAFDGVPVVFKQAQFWLARERALNGPLYETLGAPLVTMERKQLQGVGEKETHYAAPGAVSNVDRFGKTGSMIDALLGPYTRSGSAIQQARIDLA
jgi:hypothetical protein